MDKETEDRKTGAPAPEKPKAGRHINCPVCDGRGAVLYGDRRTCRCEVCGTLFLNPRPSAGEILMSRDERFKGALVANHSLEVRESAACSVEAMRGYHFLTSGKDAPLNAFGKKMLDVGCGLGFRMREFEKYGWSGTGLEPSGNARAYTRAKLQNVVEGNFDILPDGMFDLILLEDVIEEVPDPKKLVVAIRESLAPKGVVCASVPAPAEDESVADGKLYRFNEDSLRRLFMENGFTEPRLKTEGALRLWFQHKRKR